MKRITTALLSLVLLLSLLIPSVTFAANGFIMPNAPGNLPNTPFDVMILNITSWLLSLVIILALLVIVYGGVYYITSVGEADRIETAKTILTYGIVGLVIAGLSYAIVATVVTQVIGAK